MANRFRQFATENSQEKFDPIIDQPTQSEVLENFPEAPKENRLKKYAQINNEMPKEEEEGWGKWLSRTLLQIPKGIAQARTYPLDILQLMGYAEATDPEEIERIRRASERFGIPFDEEAYLAKADEAASIFPTVNNASRYAEENWGIPLEAKTDVQRFVNFASSAGKLSPKNYTFRGMNTSLPRPVLGTGVAATAEVAKAVGVPEPIADIGSFAILKQPTAGAGSISVGSKTKPSGLTERNFENRTKERSVSENTLTKINKNIEDEVRELTEKIVKDTPLSETRQGLKQNSQFKADASKAIDKVHELAINMPGTISNRKIMGKYNVKLAEIKPKGYAPSEYEKSFIRNLQQAKKDISKRNISTVDLVDQYRKNNASFRDLKEPGKSFAYNQAKRDALMIQNRAIADLIEEMHPGSEMATLFKETNARWSQIMDSEAIDSFLDNLFEGKVKFNEGRKFFEKNGVKEPFKKALGKEGFMQFENLMNDLMSYENGLSLLKKAKGSGYEEIAKTAGSYLIHPYLSKARFGINALKGGYRSIYNMFLQSPKIGITWNRAIKEIKAGDFKAAAKDFEQVKQAEEAIKPSEIKTKTQSQQTSKPKKSEIIEVKAEKVNTETNKAKVSPGTTSPKQENINNAFTQMGGGIVDNLYNGIFESIKNGKDTFAGIKDPLIAKAKPYYDAGLINSSKDLKEFSNNPKPFQDKLSLKQAPQSSHEKVQARIEELKAKQPPVESKRAEGERRLLEYKPKKELVNIDKLEIITERELDRSRFSHMKTIETKDGDFVGQLMYDKEKNGDIFLSSIQTGEEYQRKGVAKKLIKNLIEENPESKITISPLEPDGAKLFSKLLGRKLEPTLGAGAEPLQGIKKQDIHLSDIDLQNLRKNLGIKEKAKFEQKDAEDFRNNFMSQKTGQNIAEMNDIPFQIKKLKEKRDVIKGNSQKAIKERMPYTIKINELELELHNSKIGKKTDTPKKIDAKIEHAAEKPDITKAGLTRQKNFLLTKIDEILANAAKYPDKVEIKVPGDGIFNLKNDKQSLEKIRSTIDKKWPEKPLPNNQETYKRTALRKPNEPKEAHIERLYKEYQKAKKESPKEKGSLEAYEREKENIKEIERYYFEELQRILEEYERINGKRYTLKTNR